MHMKPPMSDNQIYSELRELFGVDKVLNHDEGEIFNQSLDENSRWELVKQLPNDNRWTSGHFYFRHKAFNRHTIDRNDEIFLSENIRKTIESNHNKYINFWKNEDVRVFVSSQLHFIEEVIKRKCPNGKNTRSNFELSLYFILQDYIKELNEYLFRETNQKEDEEKPKDDKEPVKQLRLDAFKKIILPALEEYYAIHELNKEDQGDLVRLIVGCNKIDGYKKIFTHEETRYSKVINESDFKILNRLLKNLNVKK